MTFTLARGHHETASALLRLNGNYVYALLKKLDLEHLRRPPLNGPA